jgi:hypothetical protein
MAAKGESQRSGEKRGDTGMNDKSETKKKQGNQNR